MMVFAVVAGIVNPVLESGVIDDWAYAFTARGLASTGRLIYNGWAEMIVGPQAYWGALFIKAFGFSFTALRLSTVVLILICIPVLYWLGRDAGLRPSFASFAVLTCVLSPVFVPVAISFMTDVPAWCFAMIGLLAFVRAWKSETTVSFVAWAAAGSIAGALAGCVRQNYWLLALSCLPVLAYQRFRRRERLATAFCLMAMLATAAGLVAVTRWFAAQPYVFTRAIEWPHQPLHVLATIWHRMVGMVETIALVLVPATVLYVAPSRRYFSRKVWALGALAILAAFVAYESNPPRWPPRLGDIVTEYGILYPSASVIGYQAPILGPALRLAIAAVMFATFAAFVAVAIAILRRRLVQLSRTKIWPFVALSFPFAAVMVLVFVVRIATGGTLLDRYLIVLLPILAVPILWLYQTHVREHVPAAGWLVLFLFGAYAAATTHDSFAAARARLVAADAVIRSGTPRTAIMAGGVYDGWTELEASGHINDEHITNPAGAYRPAKECSGPPELAHRAGWTPSIRARYFVIMSRLDSLSDAPFAPVRYRTWLPPYRGEVFTQMLPDGGTVGCL
jgi:hypothetical protein